MAKRTVFYISDQTGITSETLGHSLLSQFDQIEFEHITLPFVDTPEKAHDAVHAINHTAELDQARPIIFDTIISKEIRAIISKSNGFMLDIFSAFISSLEKELHTDSARVAGRSHAITDDLSYKTRINAVHFALESDDGSKPRNFAEAEIILIGVSRCGKTPTCLYLALQFGIKAANYPITEEDMEDFILPKSIQAYKEKLFGLTIEPERLAAIRNERRPNSRYAGFHQCQKEIEAAEALFRKEKIPHINTSQRSIEEIATKILAETGITRRLQ